MDYEKYKLDKENLKPSLLPFCNDHLWMIREGAYAAVEDGHDLFEYEDAMILGEAATEILEERGLINPDMEEDNCRLPGPWGPGTRDLIDWAHIKEAKG